MIEHSQNAPVDPCRIIAAHAMGLIQPGQIWRGLPAYPRYMVGSHGEVISFVKREPRLLKMIAKGAYPGFSLVRDDGKVVGVYLHHLVAEAFWGPRPPDKEVAHGDGDKANCDALNLRWATHADNEQDKVRLGTLPRGEATGHARLTSDDVRLMRAIRSETGRSFASIAEQFGVSTMTAHRAITGKCWGHIQ